MRNTLLSVRTHHLSHLKKSILSKKVYVILDPCGHEAMLKRIVGMPPEQCACLYQGKAYQDLWAVAPYLVRLDLATVNWLVETVWDQPWGILVFADCCKNTLRRHLRKFLFVEDSQGKSLYFRFYDPRLLASFLALCNNGEVSQIFEPILHLGIKSTQIGTFTVWSYNKADSSPSHSISGQLKIRNELIDELQQQKMQGFKSRLIQSIKVQLPDHYFEYNQSQLSSLLDQQITQAKQFDLRSETDIARFIMILYQHSHSETLLADKKVLNLLHDHRLSTEQRLDQLQEFILKDSI